MRRGLVITSSWMRRRQPCRDGRRAPDDTGAGFVRRPARSAASREDGSIRVQHDPNAQRSCGDDQAHAIRSPPRLQDFERAPLNLPGRQPRCQTAPRGRRTRPFTGGSASLSAWSGTSSGASGRRRSAAPSSGPAPIEELAAP